MACIAVLTTVCRQEWEALEAAEEAPADESDEPSEATYTPVANPRYAE